MTFPWRDRTEPPPLPACSKTSPPAEVPKVPEFPARTSTVPPPPEGLPLGAPPSPARSSVPPPSPPTFACDGLFFSCWDVKGVPIHHQSVTLILFLVFLYLSLLFLLGRKKITKSAPSWMSRPARGSPGAVRRQRRPRIGQR